MKSLKRDVSGCAWCGPTAIGAITGQPLSKVRDAIHQARGNPTTQVYSRRGWTFDRKRPIMGTSTGDVTKALRILGWASIPVSVKTVWDKPPTLAAFLRARPKELMNVHLLIEVTHHWVVVKGRKFVDTFTKGEPVFIGKAPGRRKRVQRVWRVEKV